MSNNLYDTLGVDPEATPDEIKAAFRRKANKVHPDKPSGDEEQFKMVRSAYEVLSDPKRRENYDRTGRTDAFDVDEAAAQGLAQLFGQFIDNCADPDLTNLVAKVEEHLKQSKVGLEQKIKAAERDTLRLEKILKRVRRKSQGRNLLADVTRLKIEHLRQQIENMRQMLAVGEAMLKLLADYEYEVDQKPAYQNPYVTGLGSTIFGDVFRGL